MLETLLAEVDAKLAACEVGGAMRALSGLLRSCDGDVAARDELMAWAVARVGDEHPQIGAQVALVGGALVEGGAPAEALGRAVVAPIERALRDAARMAVHAREHGRPLAAQEEQEEDDGDGPPPAAEVCGFALTEVDLDAIAAKDRAAVRAWASLEVWFRPAVTAWTRAPALLREAQGRASLRAALEPLGSEAQTSHWLGLLVHALAAAPLVVLVPELREAWALTADGVVDVGQLTVLLSRELREPLARLGASGVATAEQLAVMDGSGPQSGPSGFESTFALYPPEAVDPADGLPRDGVHTWRAPGGTGSHSLPGDFLPGALPEVDGARLVVLVGPKAPGLRFVRIIGSSRPFDALPARISGTRRLSGDEERHWAGIAAAIGARARAGRAMAPGAAS